MFCPYTFWQRIKWWWKVRTLSKEELAEAYRDAARQAEKEAFEEAMERDTSEFLSGRDGE